MSALSSEAQARALIDKQLQQAGWIVQDRIKFNPATGMGIAVREFPLRTGFADYLRLVERKAVGAVDCTRRLTQNLALLRAGRSPFAELNASVQG